MKGHRSLAILLVFLLLACTDTASAAPLRIASLQPGSAAGEWTVTVLGKEAKKPDSLVFSADGKPLPAEALGTDGDTARLLLKGVPAGAFRLEVGMRGKEKDGPLAVVRVGARDARSSPFSDWTIYHVTMSMFANGSKANDGQISGWKHPNYAGGDLQGVLEHAAHIQDLGANAVWLSPVFAARSSHGYDVTNYYRIADAVAVPGDSQASLELFRKLVQDLHRRGIKVILDIPLNHSSASYQRPEGDPRGLKPRSTRARQEAEKTWESWGSDYRFWDFGDEATRRFLKDAALYWLRDEGVDGLRLDYVRGVPHDFWAELYGEVQQAKPGAFLVGEAWIDAQGEGVNARDIATYYERVNGRPQLDSLLDFPLQIVMTRAFAQGGSAADLETWLQETEAEYGPDAQPTYFLDNHDMARFMAWTDKPGRLAAAVGFLASLSSPIVLFYGTETGLSHGAPKSGFTDVGRIPMPWGSLDQALMGRVRQVLQLRREHPALTRGGRLPLAADKDVLVMAKVAPEETVLVGVNLSGAPREVELDLGSLLPAGAKLTPLLGGAAEASEAGGRLKWRLPPLATSMLAGPGLPISARTE